MEQKSGQQYQSDKYKDKLQQQYQSDKYKDQLPQHYKEEQMLTEWQQERYARHLTMEEIGIRGQQKLFRAKICVIGAGGLGSPAALYLAAAGVGTIGIVDADCVELSNLQRQILHTAADLGKQKVRSAQETLQSLNPDTSVRIYPVFAGEDNIQEIIQDYDFIVDASDNFPTKFLINDACVRAGKPFVHAGVIRLQGQLMTYVPGKGPCYRCIFKDPPPQGAVPSAKQAGILGAVCGVAGSLQAMEAVKYVLGTGELLTGKLLTYDALQARFRVIKLPGPAADCAVCGNGKADRSCRQAGEN